jgi:hypothetical protein
VKAFKPCVALIKRRQCRRRVDQSSRRGLSSAKDTSGVDTPGDDDALFPETAAERETQIATQALAQEQALFDRKMEKDNALFKLQLAMAWTTFLMIPAALAAIVVFPPAATGLVPLTGLAAWNWRRTLRRDSGEIEVLTKPPADHQ